MDINQQNEVIKEKLKKIKNTIVVLSGKGGVGKSTVATNIAVSLSLKGYKTGLFDVDVHGPSVPTSLRLEDTQLLSDGEYILPVKYNENLKVISTGFMVDNQQTPIVWRGPMKISFIRQMISDVSWDELDYLIVDCPPGTGDEPLSVVQTLENVTGAIIVTTPQKLAVVDVEKSINFCKQLQTPIIGVIENMSGFVCPKCGEKIEIFKSGGGENMAKEMGVPFLGKISIEPKIVEAGDSGKPFTEFYPESNMSKDLNIVIDKIL